MSIETKRPGSSVTLNTVAAFLADLKSAFGKIDPDFDPNNPAFKRLTAGYLNHLASVVKDQKLKVILQKEASSQLVSK